MNKQRPLWPMIVLTAGLIGAYAAASSQASLSDADIGLTKTSVFDVPSPDAVVGNASDPGDEPVIPRAYHGAPPRIPHEIESLIPITIDENSCVDCHEVEEKAEGEPTPIPESHFTDLRNAPTRVGDAIVGARWICVTCHVPVTDATPLVENRFAE